MRREVHDALDGVERDAIVGSRLADARRQDEAEIAVAGFFVGAHGVD
jgi:hypothetical protein